jgi:hypothetical protein
MVYPTGGPKKSGAGEAATPPAQARGGGTQPLGEGAHAPPVEPSEAQLQKRLQLAFAPIHKRAFGMAVGTACALLLAGVTLFHLLLEPENGIKLGLLRNYFYGYRVSWGGVLIGAFWGFFVGFVGGWFAAFCRNLVIAILVFVTRTRAELAETRDFLDHI